MNSEISVVITCFNSEAFIHETLDCILSQTLLPDQIIIIDDGSTDKTAEIVKSFKEVTYIYQENQGVGTALNNGIKHCTGKFIALLDHDDRWLPDKLKKQYDYLLGNPDCELIFTHIKNFFSEGIDESLKRSILLDAKTTIGIHKSTLLIRKTSFDKVGKFVEDSRIDFLSWYAKALDAGVKQHIIDEILVERRIHNSNMTLTNKEIKNDFPKLLKAILDRRRSAQND